LHFARDTDALAEAKKHINGNEYRNLADARIGRLSPFADQDWRFA